MRLFIGLIFIGCVVSFGAAGLLSNVGGFLSDNNEVIPGAMFGYWKPVLRKVAKYTNGDGVKPLEALIGVLHGFDDSFIKGDINEFRDYFQEGSDLWVEILPTIENEGLRQTVTQIIQMDDELLGKLNSGSATFKDVDEFFKTAALSFIKTFTDKLADAVIGLLRDFS